MCKVKDYYLNKEEENEMMNILSQEIIENGDIELVNHIPSEYEINQMAKTEGGE